MNGKNTRIDATACSVGNPPRVDLAGDWKVAVAIKSESDSEAREIIDIPIPLAIKVRDEKYDGLPEFNPETWAGWQKGIPLNGVKAQECVTCFALDPDSLKVSSGTGKDAVIYERGRDYDADLGWASVGRLPLGRIKTGQPVFISYEYIEPRLDSIIMDASGRMVLKPGVPHIATPLPPELDKGEIRLANVFIDRKLDKLHADCLFPILETAYPEPPKKSPSVAERLLPKTMKQLRNGGKLKILAWGDSVTDGGFLADIEKERWQSQFVARLRERYPKAEIELITEAWGGRNTSIYLAEPPGSIHNYKEKVLDARPDLIVMEFVNDAGLQEELFETQYGKLLEDIRGIGAEWIILSPHYIRPDWMGLTSQKEIDDDPRKYVKFLRKFTAEKQIPLADASLRYGRLWRQGIPYNTLMKNNINHPDARGMKIFADSLMEIFF